MKSTNKIGIPCLIQRNTENLRQKLENLGYINWFCIDEDCGIIATSFNFKFQNLSMIDKEESCYLGIEDLECIQDYIDEGYIDCGENEDLFLSLASFREDTDKNQLFIYDGPKDPERSVLVRCELENWEDDFYSWNNDDDIQPWMYHKASPQELINYYHDE